LIAVDPVASHGFRDRVAVSVGYRATFRNEFLGRGTQIASRLCERGPFNQLHVCEPDYQSAHRKGEYETQRDNSLREIGKSQRTALALCPAFRTP
jgi:hypothetical protein